MIKGIHAMFFSSQPEELRAFLRDKLQIPSYDAGEGWLIFELPKADLGCHGTDEGKGPPSGTHDISFFCDDIESTVTSLRERGVEFLEKITDQGWGRAIRFEMPGGVKVMLYQPLYGKSGK